MDRFRRIAKEKEPINSNEIRVTAVGNVFRYMDYAKTLLADNKRQLIIKATGNAISKAVTVAELLKRTYAGLHQILVCGSTTVKDMYEPTEEGLAPVTEERVIAYLEITLSLDPLDKDHPGYQAPLDPSVVEEFDITKTRISDGGSYRGRGLRRGYRGAYRGGRGRGGRGAFSGTEGAEGEEYGEPSEGSESRGRGRGRARGRGRGFRGRRGGAFRGARSE